VDDARLCEEEEVVVTRHDLRDLGVERDVDADGSAADHVPFTRNQTHGPVPVLERENERS
jgi:hypothetical protein